MTRRGGPTPGTEWFVLIHQLPPRPLYLRAKVRRRLAKVGALAVKNSVYVLPARDECLEDFQWIAQEAVAGGGEASICRAEFIEGLSAEALVDRFKADVAARYGPVKEALGRTLRQIRKAGGAGAASSRMLRLRKQAQEIRQTDFFGSSAGREVNTMMTAIDRARTGSSRRRKTDAGRRSLQDLVGRVWVTRRDPRIDRLATAWLVRRFIDPAARFRFVGPAGGDVRPNELSFDMTGADFTHDGDRCTFETVVARLGLDDAGLRQIGEIVHDIDLKDAKFGRPDAPGVHQLVQGLVGTHPDSAARIAAGLTLFDALYTSFGGSDAAPTTVSPGASKRPKARAAGTRKP
jgi:hypothetical protein